MRWSLTKATEPTGQAEPTESARQPSITRSNHGFEEDGRRSVLLARLQDLVAWGRKNSVWPFNFGLSCCYVEMATSITSKYDIARFGAEVIRGTPREADLMVIAGTVFIKMAPVIQRLYEQMMEPRWVISMGSCANSGGMYDIYSVVQGVDTFLPVDVYVPGCPPRPDAFMEGLLLQDAIGKERRPLSWVVGPQGIERSDRLSQRDLKQSRTNARDCAAQSRRGLNLERNFIQCCPGTLAFRTFFRNCRIALARRSAPSRQPATASPRSGLRGTGARDILRYLKLEAERPYRMLYDLTAIDERMRVHREGQPASDFTVVYHLLSFDRNADIRLKVALPVDDADDAHHHRHLACGQLVRARSLGHVRHRLRRPPALAPHPACRRPGRVIRCARTIRRAPPRWAPFRLPRTKEEAEQEALRFHPEEWGMRRAHDGTDFMFLNLGPQPPGTHGVLRIVLQLDGEEIVDAVPDIGFHHRGAEKMGERQSWHTYIPYTDRVDYLGGVMNNLPYVLAVEKLAGIEVPDRVQVIRVMMAELFRISSHLVWYGTFAQDLGALSPVFYMFNDRERAVRHHRSDLRRAHASELVSHRRRRAGPADGLG